MADEKPDELRRRQRTIKIVMVGIVAAFALAVATCDSEPPDDRAALLASEGRAEAISAEELLTAYAANVIAANQRFEGKPLIVSGVVSMIGENAGSPYLDLTAGTPTVLAKFDPAESPEITKLSRGEAVRLLCEDSFESELSVVLEGCLLR